MSPLRIVQYFIGLLLGVWMLGCASLLTLPTARELKQSGIVDLDVDSTILDRGRALTITECDGCHRMYWPAEYTAMEWREIVPDMAERSSLGEEDTQALLLYLEATGYIMDSDDGTAP